MLFSYLLYKMSREHLVGDDGMFALGLCAFAETLFELTILGSVLLKHL